MQIWVPHSALVPRKRCLVAVVEVMFLPVLHPWLVTLFFATSFGLAVIAKENSMAAGNVDLPMPAVIESFEMPADVRESDIPGVDAAVFEEIPGADVPVEGSGSDIPGL